MLKLIFQLFLLLFITVSSVSYSEVGEVSDTGSLSLFGSVGILNKSLQKVAEAGGVASPGATDSLPKIISAGKSEAIASNDTDPLSGLMTASLAVGERNFGFTDISGSDKGGESASPVSLSPSQSSELGLLPMPVATVVSDVGNIDRRLARESSQKTVTDPDRAMSIPGMRPPETTFGTARGDESIWQNAYESGQEAIAGSGNFGDANLGAEDPKKKEEDEKEKQAKEKLDQGIREIAERSEDDMAFGMPDYLKARELIKENEKRLGKMDPEELDERFKKNIRAFYDRFGEEDRTAARQPFDRFLKNIDGPGIQFRPVPGKQPPPDRHNRESH